MKIPKNGKQSIAWLCTITLTISSAFGNTVFAGQDEEWITKGTHSYHDCLIDEDCLEEMAVLFEDAEFLEEQGWTEEEGQLEMLKEMVRIYDLFGEEPVQGWAYYADLAGIEIDENLASASNADRNTETATASNAKRATASNAQKASDGDRKLATSSDLPSGFAALKKAVKGEAPKYQDYYCTEIQDDLGLELAELDEDGRSAAITFAPDQRPRIVIKGEKEVYGQIFANVCENDQFAFSLCGLDDQGRELPGEVFERQPRMWDLQDQNWYNNCGYNRWQAPDGTSQLRLTLSLSENAAEQGFAFSGAPTMNASGEIEFFVTMNRDRHITFSYPTADSFGGSSSDDGKNANLTFKDFAVFSNELYGTIGHIEGNIAVGKVTNQKVDTATNQNVLDLNADSSRITYLKYPSQSLPITATQGSGAEIVLGSGADIWVGTNGHGNKGEWYVKFPNTGDDTCVGSSSQVKYIVQEDDTENGGFSIDIDRALNQLSAYHPADTAEVSTDERSVIIDCEQETTVVTVKAKDLEKEWLKLYHMDESKNLIINVDTEGVSTVNIYTKVSLNGEGQLSDWQSIAGNIVWNFGTFHGKVNGYVMNSGLLLVPKGDVELSANWNGCIAADRVANSGAEIHKVTPVVPDPEPTTDTTTTTEGTTSTTEGTTTTTEGTTTTTEDTTTTTESTTTTVTESSTETTTESTTSTGTSTTEDTTSTTEGTTTTTEGTTTTTEGTTSTTEDTTSTTESTTTTVTESSTETTTESTTTTSTKPTTTTATTTKSTTTTSTKPTTTSTTSATTTTGGTTTTTATTTKHGGGTTSDKTTKETTERTTTVTESSTETTSEATTKTTGSSTTTTAETTKSTTGATTTTEATSVTTTVTEASTETTSEATTETTTSVVTTTRRGSSGGGGGNGGRSSGGGGNNGGTTPTVPIVDNPVPLGNVPVPDDPDMDLVLIDDPDVPLTGLPKTGDSSGTKLLILALSLSALILQLKKQREEKEDES